MLYYYHIPTLSAIKTLSFNSDCYTAYSRHAVLGTAPLSDKAEGYPAMADARCSWDPSGCFVRSCCMPFFCQQTTKHDFQSIVLHDRVYCTNLSNEVELVSLLESDQLMIMGDLASISMGLSCRSHLCYNWG